MLRKNNVCLTKKKKRHTFSVEVKVCLTKAAEMKQISSESKAANYKDQTFPPLTYPCFLVRKPSGKLYV